MINSTYFPEFPRLQCRERAQRAWKSPKLTSLQRSRQLKLMGPTAGEESVRERVLQKSSAEIQSAPVRKKNYQRLGKKHWKKLVEKYLEDIIQGWKKCLVSPELNDLKTQRISIK